MVSCHSCNNQFDGYKDLALHIASTKKGHRKGKKWAASYLLKVNALNSKKDNYGRSQLTEVEKENKKEMGREISGETMVVDTSCPNCKRKSPQILPVEFGRSSIAWRDNKYMVVLCSSCRGNRYDL